MSGLNNTPVVYERKSHHNEFSLVELLPATKIHIERAKVLRSKEEVENSEIIVVIRTTKTPLPIAMAELKQLPAELMHQ